MLADLIDPIDAFVGKLVYGPMHRFVIHRSGGFSGAEIEMLLRRYGIRIWGREIHDDEFAFLVKQSQAVWAEYILCRAGVPLSNGLLDQRNAGYRERHEPGTMPIPWDEQGIAPHSFVDHVVDWMVRLFG